MPLLDKQYTTFETSQQRSEFRAEFEKLSEKEQESVIDMQNVDSLTRLRDSYDGLIRNHSAVQPPAVISRWNKFKTRIVSEIEYRSLSEFKPFVPKESEELIRVNNHPKSFYIQLFFLSVLKKDVIDKVFQAYLSEDPMLAFKAIRDDVIYVDKKKILGHEQKISASIQSALLSNKEQVVNLLKKDVEFQMRRCESDPLRRGNVALSKLFKEGEQILTELNASLDTNLLDIVNKVSKYKIQAIDSLEQYNTQFAFVLKIQKEQEVKREFKEPKITEKQYISLEKPEERTAFRAEFEKKFITEQKYILREQSVESLIRLRESYAGLIKNNSATQPAKVIKQWSEFKNIVDAELDARKIINGFPKDIRNLFSVNNDIEDCYVTLYFPKNLQEAMRNAFEKYIFVPHEGPMLCWAPVEDAIYLDKQKIRGHEAKIEAVFQQKLSENMNLIKNKFIDEIQFQMERCCSDDSRKADETLNQLVNRGKKVINTLDGSSITDMIEKTQQYKDEVSAAIEKFKENSNRYRPTLNF